MDIPSSITNTWERVSSDGVIDKKDVQDIKNVMTGNGGVDLDEIEPQNYDFLSKLDKAVYQSKSGSALVKNLSFIDKKLDIPSSITNTWKKVSSDGSINKKDVQDIKNVMTGNGAIELDELDQNDYDFVSKLDNYVSNNTGGVVSVKELTFINVKK